MKSGNTPSVERVAWRCFPWDPASREGKPFSPSYLQPGQTVGRFDLHDEPPIRYLAESAEHALAEALAPFRGTTFRPEYLIRNGHPLALVPVEIADSLWRRIADCTLPETLTRFSIGPDALAHHDRAVTQAISRRLHDAGIETRDPAGLRWWSALTGAWHTAVVFMDREKPGDVTFGVPQWIDRSDPALLRAAVVLGIRMSLA